MLSSQVLVRVPRGLAVKEFQYLLIKKQAEEVYGSAAFHVWDHTGVAVNTGGCIIKLLHYYMTIHRKNSTYLRIAPGVRVHGLRGLNRGYGLRGLNRGLGRIYGGREGHSRRRKIRRAAVGPPSDRRRVAVGAPSDRRQAAVGPPSDRRRSAVGPRAGPGTRVSIHENLCVWIAPISILNGHRSWL